MDHSRKLGEASIASLLLKFSVPAITGMLVQAMYNIVDRIFIGRAVGSIGIAAVTVAFPVMLIMMAFGMLVGLGANSLISINLGAGKKEEAEKILGNAVILFVIISAGLSGFGLLFLDPLLKFFGASAAVLPYARAFTSVILVGSIFQSFSFGMNNFIRGEGNPKIAMLTMLVGALLNVLLCPIFIFWLHMGIVGSALATVSAQMVSSLWVMYYFLGGSSVLKVRKKNLRLDRVIVLKIIAIGSAPFLMQIVASVLNAVMNNQLSIYGGDTAISAMGIIFSIMILFMMPIFGINQGIQPIIGYNYGAKKFDRVKQTLQLGILAASALTVTGFVVTRFFPEQLIHMFSRNDASLLAIGTHGMNLFLLMLPIVGFQIVSANYFQAVGKPKQAMFLSLARQLIFLIPALFILPRFYGLDGVWYAGPLSDFGSSVITAIWLIMELANLKDKHHTQNQAKAPEFQISNPT
ncbi:MAG: MATE family efflux transporter [Candidatus Margulisiibacteriota bacterium]|nr:MAG: MATE family efflux transporter [Candidatus Margulisbacteria bacterium GWD2_39_127]OGI02548.1 MAG: MATE family efflux transporter [Candidatus Margulisbacteria bacterium GWF2_38_17]OGI11454.1 MAG: MATE family efflux transporter [Candidatus Margulisbacteria bacterium GWE2_39_32]PZM79754.1 MAG: MATE family efflux transporter [Candidatus Margulisiibacteriota bacterium]HAR64242.1 MATE family efflux transporter [Candidatus Margulisiibacteriota bacterium]